MHSYICPCCISVGSRALTEPLFSLCHLCVVLRFAGFSGLSLWPGECAGGSSNFRVQHRRPLLSPGARLLVSQRTGHAHIGQGIQGAIRVHHHVNYCPKRNVSNIINNMLTFKRMIQQKRMVLYINTVTGLLLQKLTSNIQTSSQQIHFH